MSTWEVEHDRTNVVCPDCAFSFDAIHQDGDGGYTCPLCEPAPASGDPSGADAVVREAYAVIDELAPQWSGSSIASVLRAYLERMAVPYPWRPIETAPKDGSRVLLAGCGENGGWVCVASWRGGRWRDGDYSIEPPTHWMPLPQAPTAPGAPEEGAGE